MSQFYDPFCLIYSCDIPCFYYGTSMLKDSDVTKAFIGPSLTLVHILTNSTQRV